MNMLDTMTVHSQLSGFIQKFMTKGECSLFLLLLSSCPANIQSMLVLAGTTETILNQAGKTINQESNRQHLLTSF